MATPRGSVRRDTGMVGSVQSGARTTPDTASSRGTSGTPGAARLIDHDHDQCPRPVATSPVYRAARGHVVEPFVRPFLQHVAINALTP